MDFTLRSEGNIFLLTPRTAAARTWVKKHIPEDATRWCNAVIIEHRYVNDILEGIEQAGLTVVAG